MMWMGEQINQKGIGNGISLLIFAGLVAEVPGQAISLISAMISGELSILAFVGVIIGVLVIITAITYVDQGERRVPVQYAKRVVGRKMYGGQSTFIPIKVNHPVLCRLFLQ